MYHKHMVKKETDREIIKKRKEMIYDNTSLQQGTTVAQWLRRCATNRKVTGSIPDGVIGIYH